MSPGAGSAINAVPIYGTSSQRRLRPRPRPVLNRRFLLRQDFLRRHSRRAFRHPRHRADIRRRRRQHLAIRLPHRPRGTLRLHRRQAILRSPPDMTQPGKDGHPDT
jgi:hypothetical protein